jgi:hypothetical protein
MKNTVVTLPNGMRVVITPTANPSLVAMFQEAFKKINN